MRRDIGVFFHPLIAWSEFDADGLNCRLGSGTFAYLLAKQIVGRFQFCRPRLDYCRENFDLLLLLVNRTHRSDRQRHRDGAMGRPLSGTKRVNRRLYSGAKLSRKLAQAAGRLLSSTDSDSRGVVWMNDLRPSLVPT